MPGIERGIGDAFGRGRMRGQEFLAARIGLGAGAQFGVATHRGEEAGGAERIVAGARGNTDADAVGFEFLAAREGGERDLGFGQRQRARLRIAQHVAGNPVDQRGLADLVLADRGMAGHLVRQHRGDFRCVIRQSQQPAGDIELAGRQREGIDRRRVQDRDLVMHFRTLGGGDQLLHRGVELLFQLGIGIGAAIDREDAAMLALRRRQRLGALGRRRFGQGDVPRGLVGRARTGAEQQRQRNRPAPPQPRWPHRTRRKQTPRPHRRRLMTSLMAARPSRIDPPQRPRSRGRSAPRSHPAPARRGRPAIAATARRI